MSCPEHAEYPIRGVASPRTVRRPGVSCEGQTAQSRRNGGADRLAEHVSTPEESNSAVTLRHAARGHRCRPPDPWWRARFSRGVYAPPRCVREPGRLTAGPAHGGARRSPSRSAAASWTPGRAWRLLEAERRLGAVGPGFGVPERPRGRTGGLSSPPGAPPGGPPGRDGPDTAGHSGPHAPRRRGDARKPGDGRELDDRTPEVAAPGGLARATVLDRPKRARANRPRGHLLFSWLTPRHHAQAAPAVSACSWGATAPRGRAWASPPGPGPLPGPTPPRRPYGAARPRYPLPQHPGPAPP